MFGVFFHVSLTARERQERTTWRRLRWPVLGLAGVLAVAALWAGWTVWQVQRDLGAARASAAALPSTISADPDAAEGLVTDLATSAGSAVDRTSGVTWRVLESMPAV